MNNTQHTPGPWKALPVEPGKEVIRIRGTRLGERHKIANVSDFDYKEMPQAFVDKERAESLANARLIAAAPETAAERDMLRELVRELRDALELAIQVIDATGPGSYPEAEEQIRAVIAKAKGGSQ